MDEQTPVLALLVALVAVIAVSLVARPHEGGTPAALAPLSTPPDASGANATPANVTPVAPSPTAANATTSHAPSEPTPSKSTPAPSPTPAPASPSPAPPSTPTPPPAASAPAAAPNATPPPTNQTIAWNATLGDSTSCVNDLGVPLCAPTGGGGASRASKALGGGDVSSGAIAASWNDSAGGAVDITIRLLAGSDCASGSCSVLRELNVSATGTSPLRLAVPSLALAGNETLVLEAELDCSSTFGSCTGASESIHVDGWLLRVLTTG